MNSLPLRLLSLFCAFGLLLLAVEASAADVAPIRHPPTVQKRMHTAPAASRVRSSDMALLNAQRWLKSLRYDRTLAQVKELKRLRLQMYGKINGVSTQTLISNQNLAHLKVLTNLEELALPVWTNDSGLRNVAGLTKLTSLNIPQAPITDVGMGYLKNMTHLHSLVLGSRSITDAGLANLSGMHALDILNLSGSSITDAGMVEIGKLTGLSKLFLNHTAITDASIPEIIKLRYLQRLDITGTHITPAGRQQIAAAIPGIVIHH